LIQSGDAGIAEEVFCDLNAVHEAVFSTGSPLSDLELYLRLRVALFGFVCVSFLSLLSFSARVAARREFLGMQPADMEDGFAEASRSIRRRMFEVEQVIALYAELRGIPLYGREASFNLVYSPIPQLLEVLVSFEDLSPSMVFGSTLCDAEYRNIARFLALNMLQENSGHYLLWCSQDLSVEFPANC
ncbi:hypothetical protein, partial [Roseateles sp. P5_E11]